MIFATVWTFLFSFSLLAAFPGEGPGLQDHPLGYSGVVRDRLKHHLSSAGNKYFWYVKDYTGEFSNALDWSLGMMFHEGIRNKQGLNYETEAELRQKRLGKVGELLAIVIMSAGCLTVVRLAFRKNFSSQRRRSQAEKQSGSTRRQNNSGLRSSKQHPLASSPTL